MTLLIVDDNARLRRMLYDLLTKQYGPTLSILECGTGREAVAMAREHQTDWILMDIKLPDIDGFTASRRILKEAPGRKIIIVTSYDEPEYRDEAQRLGAAGYVLKDNLFALFDIL
ncbi:MAG: response regulator transcription factor [candidate division KSB1 bacterium]|nr:response regulator transcription factor [candidate division KSB1 bacterium]MDQ7063255.1 response regulator transcription factor [candidate division KSB1 bacterium]